MLWSRWYRSFYLHSPFDEGTGGDLRGLRKQYLRHQLHLQQCPPADSGRAAEPNPAEQGRRNQRTEGHLSTEVQQQIRRV